MEKSEEVGHLIFQCDGRDEEKSNEKSTTSDVDSMPSLSSAARSNLSAPLPKKKGWGGRTKIGKGDVVSVPATIFDGDDPGSYSNEFPDRCY